MKPIWLFLAAPLLAASSDLGLVGAQEAAAPAVSPPPSDERYTEDASSEEQLEAERQAIWDSEGMVEAREWLTDHMARSAQITPSQSKRYMEELARLNPAQLKLWLITFEEQQAERIRQRESFERARQQSVDNAMRNNRATQQAADNINRTRNEAAQVAQDSIATQQRAAEERSRQLVSDRDAAARAALQPTSYIWLNTLPWGPYAGYPVGGGAAIDPAAFQGVLGVGNLQPPNTVAPGAPQGRDSNR